MNMWQISNSTSNVDIKLKKKIYYTEAVLPDYTYWITAEHLTHGHMKKLEDIKKVYMKLTVILRQQEKVQD